MGWNQPLRLGTPEPGIVGQPAAVARSALSPNVYVRGGDNSLWQRAYDNNNGNWRDWKRHDDGGVLLGAPAAVSMHPDHEALFVRGGGDQIWYKWWQPDVGWTPAWNALGRPDPGFTDGATVVSRRADYCNIYVRGNDGALWQRAFAADTWRPWQRHDDGFELAGTPTAGSMADNHEHVFVQGVDGQLWEKSFFDGQGWTEWTALGRPSPGFIGPPAVISREREYCNVYMRGLDNALWQLAFANNVWRDWERLDGEHILGTAPATNTRSPVRESVFFVDSAAQLWEKPWFENDRISDQRHLALYGALRTAVLTRFFAFGRYERANQPAMQNALGYVRSQPPPEPAPAPVRISESAPIACSRSGQADFAAHGSGGSRRCPGSRT